MSGGCWNYMNDSAASEILGYHIYVGYGLDSERHNENYKMVVRDNPLGDPEISALVYDVFCLLHSYDWAESGDTDMNDYAKDGSPYLAIFCHVRKKDVPKFLAALEDLKKSMILCGHPHYEDEISSIMDKMEKMKGAQHGDENDAAQETEQKRTA